MIAANYLLITLPSFFENRPKRKYVDATIENIL